MKTKVGLRLIRRVVQQIIDRYHPQRVVLFGSYAHGRPSQDSDVDLLVVMKSKKGPVDRAIEVSKSLYFYPFPMDILVRTPQEIHRRLRIGDAFFEDILSHGKVLYEHRPKP